MQETLTLHEIEQRRAEAHRWWQALQAREEQALACMMRGEPVPAGRDRAAETREAAEATRILSYWSDALVRARRAQG